MYTINPKHSINQCSRSCGSKNVPFPKNIFVVLIYYLRLSSFYTNALRTGILHCCIHRRFQRSEDIVLEKVNGVTFRSHVTMNAAHDGYDTSPFIPSSIRLTESNNEHWENIVELLVQCVYWCRSVVSPASKLYMDLSSPPLLLLSATNSLLHWQKKRLQAHLFFLRVFSGMKRVFLSHHTLCM